MKTHFGRFIWNSDRSRPDFVCDDGRVLAQIEAQEAPIEEHIAVTLDGRTLVEYRRDQSVAAAPSSTHSRVALAYVKASFQDGDQAFIDKRAKALQDNYNRSFQGRRTMEAVGFLVPLEDMRVDLDDHALFRAIDDASGNQFDYLHALGGAKPGHCGIAKMSGNRAITFTPWRCFEPTDWHEHGHNKGLHHSAKDGVEYGERDRIMGSGRGRKWFNAPHLYYLGGLDESHVDEFLDEGHGYLVGFNTLELAVPSGADRMLLLRQDAKHRMISVSLDGDHLDVHVPFTDYSRSWGKTNHIATIRPGESFEAVGRHIHFEEYRDGVASVVIDHSANRRAWPAYPEIDTIGFDDCLGLWGNPHWGGQGIHILPGMRVVWLTWDYNYNPVWYSGAINGSGKLGEADVSLAFTDEQNGLFRARVGDELFATPLKRLSRPVASRFWRMETGGYMTQEVAENGVRFGYLLKEDRDPLGNIHPRWQMRQDGITYNVKGGMRGVAAEYSLEAA